MAHADNSASKSAANIAVVKAFTQGFLGRGEMAAAEATVAPNVQVTTGLKPIGPINGIDEYKGVIGAFTTAFVAIEPLKIIDQFASADGSRVVTRFHAKLKHAKDFFGVPASGRTILFDETHVAHVVDGKIVENVVSATNLEFEMLMAPVLSPMILK